MQNAATTNTLYCSCHNQPRLEYNNFKPSVQTKMEEAAIPCFEQIRIAQIQAFPDKKSAQTYVIELWEWHTKKKQIEEYNMGFRPIRSDNFPYNGERLKKS